MKTNIVIIIQLSRYLPDPLPATLHCVPYTSPNVVLSSILKHGKGNVHPDFSEKVLM